MRLSLEKPFGKRDLDTEKIRTDILENQIWFQKNKKQRFLLILVFGTVAKNIVVYRQRENIIGFRKLKEIDKGIKGLISIIKN